MRLLFVPVYKLSKGDFNESPLLYNILDKSHLFISLRTSQK